MNFFKWWSNLSRESVKGMGRTKRTRIRRKTRRKPMKTRKRVRKRTRGKTQRGGMMVEEAADGAPLSEDEIQMKKIRLIDHLVSKKIDIKYINLEIKGLNTLLADLEQVEYSLTAGDKITQISTEKQILEQKKRDLVSEVGKITRGMGVGDIGYARELSEALFKESEGSCTPCEVYALLLKSGNSEKYYIYVGVTTDPKRRLDQHMGKEVGGTVAIQYGMLICARITVGFGIKSIYIGLRKERQMTEEFKRIFKPKNVQGGVKEEVKSIWFDQSESGFCGSTLIGKYFEKSVGDVVIINGFWDTYNPEYLENIIRKPQPSVQTVHIPYNLKKDAHRRRSGGEFPIAGE